MNIKTLSKMLGVDLEGLQNDATEKYDAVLTRLNDLEKRLKEVEGKENNG